MPETGFTLRPRQRGTSSFSHAASNLGIIDSSPCIVRGSFSLLKGHHDDDHYDPKDHHKEAQEGPQAPLSILQLSLSVVVSIQATGEERKESLHEE